ncbi:hypothetical protein CHUAL_012655 [Chamberlinius hualienensis]
MEHLSENPYANATLLELLVRVQSISNMWKYHPTYFAHELDCYIGGLVTLVHAIRSGGSYKYLWLAIVLHGFVVENVVFMMPEMNNFWHAQGLLTFRCGKSPGNVAFIYPMLIYPAFVAVSQLRLPKWLQPFTVGLAVVLLDIPYDIMGVKLLWWTFHDTDPNIHDRHYWVPWTSYLFHQTLAATVAILFVLFRKLLLGRNCGIENDVTGCVWREMLTVLLTATLGMPLGVLQFIPLYHLPHDVYKIHSEIIVVMVLLAVTFITWIQTGHSIKEKFTLSNISGPIVMLAIVTVIVIFVYFPDYGVSHNALIKLLITLHFIIYILLVIFAAPENSVVTSLLEPTGPCDLMQTIQLPLGQVKY